MAFNVGDRALEAREREREESFSLQGTLGFYEVREISARQAVRLLARRRRRNIMPDSCTPAQNRGD